MVGSCGGIWPRSNNNYNFDYHDNNNHDDNNARTASGSKCTSCIVDNQGYECGVAYLECAHYSRQRSNL